MRIEDQGTKTGNGSLQNLVGGACSHPFASIKSTRIEAWR